MDVCSFCLQPGNLFTTGDSTTFACAKCQPYVQDANAESENSEVNSPVEPQVVVQDGKLYMNQTSGADYMFYCSLCNKSFDKNLKYQNHMRNHRAERKYVCPHCTKGFSQSNNLRAHLRIHTNERPYKCQECGKAFTQVTNLNNHIRLHTGEKPFACTEPGCDKAFAQVTNLNNHRKSHMREQRHFACEVCGRAFPARAQLAAHAHSAHGWAGPACPDCGEAFPCAADLLAHVRNDCRERNDAKRKIIDKDQEAKKKTSTGTLKCLFGDCKMMFSKVEELHRHLVSKHSLTVNSSKAKPTKTIDFSDEIIEIDDDEPSSEPNSPSQSRCSDNNKKVNKKQTENDVPHVKEELPESSSNSDSDTSDDDSDSRESDRRKSAVKKVPSKSTIQKDVKLVCNLCFSTFESLESLERHVEKKH